jgi:hypothetical protein
MTDTLPFTLKDTPHSSLVDTTSNISWVLRGFYSAIQYSYEKGAPRRVEAQNLIQKTVERLLNSVRSLQIEDVILNKAIHNLEYAIYSTKE